MKEIRRPFAPIGQCRELDEVQAAVLQPTVQKNFLTVTQAGIQARRQGVQYENLWGNLCVGH